MVMTLVSQAIVVVGAADPRELSCEALQGPLVPALPDPAAVGGAGRARGDHVAVDLRRPLQRRELDARTRGLIGPACGLLHQWPFHVGECTSLNTPQWLGRPNLGMASIITVQAWRVLPFAVGHLPRRARIDSEGGRRRREGRRRDRNQEADLRHAAAAAADRARRRAVRDRLHRDRHGGRLHPHERRPVQLDAGAHRRGPSRRASRAGRSARARRFPSSCCRCSPSSRSRCSSSRAGAEVA